MSNVTEVVTPIDFLLARVAEDELAARRADSHVNWLRMCDWVAGQSNPDVGLYVLDHQPIRALAECEAKREIVEEWGRVERLGTNGFGPGVLRHLASVYADHPDYRDEWRP